MNAKVWKMSVTLLLVFALSACAAEKNDQSADRDDPVMPFGVSDNDRDRGLGDGRINRWDNERNNADATSLHKNTRMDIDDKIAKAIADMDGIDSAYVIMTDNNVYVAVNMDDETGRNALNYTEERERADRNLYGAGRGRMGMGDNFKTGTNANGIGVANDSDVDDGVKARIAAKVQELAPDVKNVFVSANPDFVNRMRGYSDRFRAGQPIRGAILEFNRAVERIFPDKVEINNDNR